MDPKKIWEKNRKYLLVAEAKWMSPFGLNLPTFPEIALAQAIELGDIISIHTNPLWGGSWDWLAYARKQTQKPILAKGFHDTIADVEKAFNCGADYVLTVG